MRLRILLENEGTMMERALITGITGQGVSYLPELLPDKGCEVHGIVRRMALEDPEHPLCQRR